MADNSDLSNKDKPVDDSKAAANMDTLGVAFHTDPRHQHSHAKAPLHQAHDQPSGDAARERKLLDKKRKRIDDDDGSDGNAEKPSKKMLCARPFASMRGHSAFLTFATAGNALQPDPNEEQSSSSLKDE